MVSKMITAMMHGHLMDPAPHEEPPSLPDICMKNVGGLKQAVRTGSSPACRGAASATKVSSTGSRSTEEEEEGLEGEGGQKEGGRPEDQHQPPQTNRNPTSPPTHHDHHHPPTMQTSFPHLIDRLALRLAHTAEQQLYLTASFLNQESQPRSLPGLPPAPQRDLGPGLVPLVPGYWSSGMRRSWTAYSRGRWGLTGPRMALGRDGER